MKKWQEEGTFSGAGRPLAAGRHDAGVARWLTPLMAVVWSGFVLYLGSVSRLPRVPLVSEESEASLGHFGTHLVLGALLYMLFSPAVGSRVLRLRAAALAMCATLALGVSIEIVQFFVPERSPQSSDIGYDALGALTGVLALLVPDQLRISRRLLFVVANASAVMAVAFVTVIITVQALGLLHVERCQWGWLSYPLPCFSLEPGHERQEGKVPEARPAPEGPSPSILQRVSDQVSGPGLNSRAWWVYNSAGKAATGTVEESATRPWPAGLMGQGGGL